MMIIRDLEGLHGRFTICWKQSTGLDDGSLSQVLVVQAWEPNLISPHPCKIAGCGGADLQSQEVNGRSYFLPLTSWEAKGRLLELRRLIHLMELVSSKFTKKSCLRTQCWEQLRKNPDASLWPLQTHVNTCICIYICAHMRAYVHARAHTERETDRTESSSKLMSSLSPVLSMSPEGTVGAGCPGQVRKPSAELNNASTLPSSSHLQNCGKSDFCKILYSGNLCWLIHNWFRRAQTCYL